MMSRVEALRATDGYEPTVPAAAEQPPGSAATRQPPIPRRAELVAALRDHARGLCRLQSADGRLLEVVNESSAAGNFRETSATAMVTWAVAIAVSRGYLRRGEFGACAERGWAGLAAERTGVVALDGRVSGICEGGLHEFELPPVESSDA